MLKKGDKKIISAWAFYDWANSVYPLIITTAIFPLYYTGLTRQELPDGVVSETVSFFGREFINTELCSYVISLSFLLVAIMSPFLSGIADYSGNKKRFLQFFCYLGAASTASLYFFDPANLEISMVSVLLASIGFWGSLVFYNAYLPEIAEPAHHDKISARGYSLGYLGSATLLIILLAFIMLSEPGEARANATRISLLLVAVWWIGFAQVTFRRLPNNVYGRKVRGGVIFKGLHELRSVAQYLKGDRQLKRYLVSFFVFSMAVQTVMIMAQFYGKKEIYRLDENGVEVQGMEDSGLIISILIIQFIAAVGAHLFSGLSKKFGNLRGLMIALLIWIGICVTAFLIRTPFQFYILAVFVGLVMGGVQSLSRSTYSKFLPETQDHASFFSFYDVAEKVAIVLGTFAWGYIEGITGSMRNGVLALIVFFVIGLILLFRVPALKPRPSN